MESADARLGRLRRLTLQPVVPQSPLVADVQTLDIPARRSSKFAKSKRVSRSRTRVPPLRRFGSRRTPRPSPTNRRRYGMSTLIVVGYDDPQKAEEVHLKFRRMQRDYL